MKTLTKFLFSLLIFIPISMYSQDIEIYHGRMGTSQAFVNTAQNDKKNGKIVGSVYFDHGDTITIRVINSNPGLYDYSFSSKEIKIKTPEFPDISILGNFLNAELDLETSSSSNGRWLKDESLLEEGLPKGQWPSKYKEELDKIKNLLKDADSIIRKSDFPMGIEDARKHNGTGGFSLAQELLTESKLFSTDWDKRFEKWSKEVKSKEDPYNYEPDDTRPEIELTMELYDTYYKTLIAKAKELKKTFGPDVSSTVNFETVMTDKQINVTLKATPKNDKGKIRDTIFEVKLIPNFKRPIVELVPVVTLSQSSNGQNFGIENGMITSEDKDEFNFGVGAILNVNLYNWGKRKEFSFGTGVGFSFVEESLDNLFLNANINFGDWIRLGVGYGWLQTPTGLKNDLRPGDPIGDVSNINELISYSREPALFITLVLPGINLPILNK